MSQYCLSICLAPDLHEITGAMVEIPVAIVLDDTVVAKGHQTSL